MYDPRTIANAIFDVGAERGLTFSHLQIQKLVYLAHGYHLRTTKKSLLTEQLEAWDLGPVSRTLYDALKTLGDEKMLKRIDRFDPIKRRSEPIRDIDDLAAKKAVRKVVDIYGQWSAFDLVELTHSFGSPWQRTMSLAERRTNVGMKIEDETILNFFEGFETADVEKAI
jgi:uncharacterized phage-associated protein